MATVVKDFKIKSGLIVEGTTGQINNFDILTKKEADQTYIIGLVGGSGTPENTPSTLVKRDENGDFAAGRITANRINIGSAGYIADDDDDLVIDTTANGDDVIINADDIRLNAIDDVVISAGEQGDIGGDVVLTTSGGVIKLDAADVYVGSSELDSERVATRGYVDQAELDAVFTAQSGSNSYTNDLIGDVTVDGTEGNTVTDRIASAADSAQTAAETFATNADTTLYGTVTSDIATAKLEAGVIAEGYADDAEAAANTYTNTALEDYTPTASLDTTVGGYGYLKSADLGDYATQTYVNEAVDALVDGAPGLLDTLNEIAAAINDDANYATTMTTALAGKQNNLTAGDNISIVSDTISVTGLDSADISDFNTAAVTANTGLWDTIGDAAAAQEAAEDYADSLAINYEASGAVSTHSALTTGVHGVVGDVVGTSDMQVLTSKTIDGIENTLTNIGNASLSNSSITVNGYATDLGSSVTLDTDDIEEGANHQYFTNERAANAAGVLLANADKTNIQISYNSGTGLLEIEAENGVADSTTDDLAEGENNLYFSDELALGAIEGSTIQPVAVDINSVAKQVAFSNLVATAGVHTSVTFAKADYRSAEFLVKAAYGDHTEISKVLLTLDVNDNISITEYGVVGTNGSGMSVTAVVNGDDVELRVTTINNNTTVTSVGTLLV